MCWHREIGTPQAQRRDPDEQGTRGQFKPGLSDEAHEISDETTRMFLYRRVEKFEAWIYRVVNSAYRARLADILCFWVAESFLWPLTSIGRWEPAVRYQSFHLLGAALRCGLIEEWGAARANPPSPQVFGPKFLDAREC